MQNKVLSTTTRFFHWTSSLLFLGILAFGFYITQTSDYQWMGLHKSIGALAIIIFLSRFIWRLHEGFGSLSPVRGFMSLVAAVVHWFLMIAIILMPVSGIMMSVGSGRGLSIFGLSLIDSSPDPDKSGSFIAVNEQLAYIGHETHELLPWFILAILALHIIAALKHHFLMKDNALKNMLGIR